MTPEKKAKVKKLYNVFSTIVLIVVFAFLVVVVVATVLQKKDGGDVKIFGHYMYTVITDSMEPTISPGDTIWCKEATAEDIKVGAIATFTAPSGALKGHNETHRIVSISTNADGETEILTKGDNVKDNDDWTLAPKDIKAVYVKTLPVISGIISFMLKKPFLSYILFIALPLLLVGVLFIVSYVKDKVKEETAKEAVGADGGDAEGKRVNLDDLSEEEKKKILDEFLLSQKSLSESPKNQTQDDVFEDDLAVEEGSTKEDSSKQEYKLEESDGSEAMDGFEETNENESK